MADIGEVTVTAVTGTITLADGTHSSFSIVRDGVWQQWGAPQERLGRSVDALDAMVRGLAEDGLLASSNEEG